MELSQFIILLISFVGLFIWNRTESRNDSRQMDAKLESNRQETRAILEAIQKEIKDFHGRLCAIEEHKKS